MDFLLIPSWTRERAVVYLMNHTSFGRAEAEIEIDRYITLPGQACAYKIGEIRIKQIRADAEQQLGEHFCNIENLNNRL